MNLSHTATFVISGLAVAAVGVLIFWGGTRLIDRQKTALGGWGSCLVALFGAVIIFAGVAIMAAGLLLP